MFDKKADRFSATEIAALVGRGGDGVAPGARLTIVMLTFLFPPSFSGGTRQAIELAKGLRRQGWDCIFLGANLQEALPHEDFDGFEVFRFKTPARGRRQYLIYALQVCRFLWQRRASYHLVLLHSTRPFTFLVLALLKWLKKPALVTLTLIGNDDPAALRKKSFLWKLEGLALKQCDRIVCKSSAIRQICVEEKISPARIAAIPNGADLRKFRPARHRQEKDELRQEFGIAPHAFVIAFAGRIGARKGCDLLFDAWEGLRAHIPNGLLLLIGPYHGGSPSTPEPEQFGGKLQDALAHQNERRLRFAGEVDHARLARYLRLSDCFVFPSQREGLPNSVIEAMASGLPVICSDIPGVTADLIEHGVNGLILKTRHPADLAALIRQIYEDDCLREKLGNNALESSQSRFSIDVVAARHAALYRELLQWN